MKKLKKLICKMFGHKYEFTSDIHDLIGVPAINQECVRCGKKITAYL
jgi:hypothetical protein